MSNERDREPILELLVPIEQHPITFLTGAAECGAIASWHRAGITVLFRDAGSGAWLVVFRGGPRSIAEVAVDAARVYGKQVAREDAGRETEEVVVDLSKLDDLDAFDALDELLEQSGDAIRRRGGLLLDPDDEVDA